ncbi:hypothetical protein JKP88DRAFT_227797 [Tribonema minus]|uniref:Uncharacterized protein n=1 Tax=Tribonema minus TaxID=303371 RepID=A0A835YIQ3_9STRA|nr:hypothetical protein JKP88DRAFT_227797 [Tribonema minus]
MQPTQPSALLHLLVHGVLWYTLGVDSLRYNWTAKWNTRMATAHHAMICLLLLLVEWAAVGARPL